MRLPTIQDIGLHRHQCLMYTMSLKAFALLIVSLALLGCQPTPDEVLEKYLHAELHGKYQEAFQYISSKDKTFKCFADYQVDRSEAGVRVAKDTAVYPQLTDEQDPLRKALLDKVSYQMGEARVEGHRAYANVVWTIPDAKELTRDLLPDVLWKGLGSLLLSGFDEDKARKETKKETEEALLKRLNQESCPMETVTQQITLLKEQDGWRIYLNWEQEREANSVKALTQQRVGPPSPSTRSEATTAQPSLLPSLSVGSSVTIDGIRITLHKIRLDYIYLHGFLDSEIHRSDEKYLILDVTLENVTDGQIITIQSPWSDTMIVDDFDNRLGTAEFHDYIDGDIDGAILSSRMRPGESLRDMIIFDRPVEAATQFTIISDPCFFRPTGHGTLRDLSKTKFQIRFSSSEINRSTPEGNSYEPRFSFSAKASAYKLELRPFIVNLADEGSYLKITVVIGCDSEKIAELIENRTPEIRDTILTILSSKSRKTISTEDGKMKLKDEIKKALNELAELSGVVTFVHFTYFQIL